MDVYVQWYRDGVRNEFSLIVHVYTATDIQTDTEK